MSGRRDLEALLARARGEGAEEFVGFTRFLEGDDAGLTEAEKSRLRFIRAFSIAAVEVSNEEIDAGLDGATAVSMSAQAAGFAIGLLLVQGFRERDWPKARRIVLDVVRKAMIDIERRSRDGGGGSA